MKSVNNIASSSNNNTTKKHDIVNDTSSVISDDDSLNDRTQKVPINAEAEIVRLKKVVSDKTRQISELHVLMESLEIMPGVNIDRYKSLIGTSSMNEAEEGTFLDTPKFTYN